MPIVGALAAVGTIASVASSIGGGVSANAAAGAEARLQRQQGDIAFEEAQVNATNEAYNQNQAIGRQKMAFLANGVSLEGSPTDVLAASKAYGQSSVDAILRQGSAAKTLAYGQASITANKGRAAMLSGVMSGIGTGVTGAMSAYKAGMFDPTKPTVKK